VYSYVGGLLISMSLQSRVRGDRKFIERVKVFLSAGVSKSPKDIFSDMGIDITKQVFWENGISEFEKLLTDAENLAKTLKLP